MLQRQYPVTPRGERQVVRRDQRRQLVRAVQPFQQLEHSPSILLVQIPGRFICQQHPRPGDERPGNRDALLFPSGEFPRAGIGPVLQAHFRANPSAVVKSSPRTSSGMAPFSAAVKSGSNWWRCHKNPMARFRNSASAASSIDSMAFVAKYTVPLVGVFSAASKWSKVLLPAPDGATTATISPCRKIKFASASTEMLFSPRP